MQHDIYPPAPISEDNSRLQRTLEEQRKLTQGAGNWMWASVLVTLLGVAVMFAGMYENASSQNRIEAEFSSWDRKNLEQQGNLAAMLRTKDELLEIQKSSLEQVALTKQQLAEAQDEVKRTQQQLAEQEDKILRAQAQIVATQMTLYGNQSSLAVSESLLVHKINSLNAQTQDAVNAMQSQNQAQAQQQAQNQNNIPAATAVPDPTTELPMANPSQGNRANGRLAFTGARRALPVSDTNPADPPSGTSVRGPRIVPSNDTSNLPQDTRSGGQIP